MQYRAAYGALGVAFLLALVMPLSGQVQNPGVQQKGAITAGHLVTWFGNGFIQDGGAAPGSIVTSITCGTKLTCSPNPIISTGGINIVASQLTYDLIQNVTAARLLGNPTGAPAAPSEIDLNATLAFSGTSLQRAALTGDVTAGSGSNATTIANNAVTTAKVLDANITYAKIQNVTAVRLLGNPTGGAAAPSEVSLNGTLSFTGTSLQREALTGDVTATAGSNATTIANSAVTNAKLADMTQATVKGRASGAGTGAPTDLTAAQTAAIITPLANTWTAKQTFSAGGAGINMASNALASTTQGDLEFNGSIFTNNPVASDRGIAPSVHLLRLTASQTGTNVATAQTWFPGGGATQYNAPANTLFHFKGMLAMTRSAGTTAHTIALLMGGTATQASMTASCLSFGQNQSAAQGSTLEFGNASTICTASNNTASEQNTLLFEGIVEVTTAGTLIPQFQYSSAPGGAPSITGGTYMMFTPLGVNTTASVGNFN